MHSAAHIAAVFEQHALPFAPITKPQDLFDDPHLNATGALADIELPDGRHLRAAGPFVKASGTPIRWSRPAPKLGEHNDEVLGSLATKPAPKRTSAKRSSGLPLEGVTYRKLSGRPAVKVPLSVACRADERSAATAAFVALVREMA